MNDIKIYKLLFEQIKENFALVETGQDDIHFLPNHALADLLNVRKGQQDVKYPLAIFSSLFSDDVVNNIKKDLNLCINSGYLQKEYTSNVTERNYRFSYSRLTDSIVAILINILSEDTKPREDKASAEESLLLKKAFIANVSHEIRTPLNSIIGFTGILLDSIQDEGDRKIIETIQKSGKQLLHLIHDLIDLSKIEEGKISINKQPVNLGIFMDNIREQFEGYKRNEYKLDLIFNLEVPAYLRKKVILIDEYRLHQILSNLLSNSFKFTFEGEITLKIMKENENLVFSVKDTGTGINKEDREIIFERFRQSDSRKKTDHKGTGLGLSISKGLIDLMDGDIWLESDKDKGSTFYFSIPLEESSGDTPVNTTENEEKRPAPDLSGKKILIAEDDPYSLEMLSFLVKATGADISFAEDGEQALELFKEYSYDLALLDIRLPKITGYELVKIMKSSDPSVIIVAQTAYALSEDIRTFRQKGFDEYLTKPINPDLLYKVLRKYLG